MVHDEHGGRVRRRNGGCGGGRECGMEVETSAQNQGRA